MFAVPNRSLQNSASKTGIFDLPSAAEVAAHFCDALSNSRRETVPYVMWVLKDAIPEIIAANVLMLPIKPPSLGDNGGVRDLNNNNDMRCFMSPKLQADFPVCAVLSEALQLPEVARLCAKTFGVNVEGSYLRVEYIQDTEGSWLKPHCDIKEKIFTMMIYLTTGPDAKNLGTDIYDKDVKWWGRSDSTFNHASVWVPGANTWHGFEKRNINGVRRAIQLNYVDPSWRDRDQLCFPDRPITTK